MRWHGGCTMRRMLERSIEKLLFASRWLLAPMYLGCLWPSWRWP